MYDHKAGNSVHSNTSDPRQSTPALYLSYSQGCHVQNILLITDIHTFFFNLNNLKKINKYVFKISTLTKKNIVNYIFFLKMCYEYFGVNDTISIDRADNNFFKILFYE